MRAIEPEVVVGRFVAACVHPLAAWRVLPRSGRAVIWSAYFAAAFVTMFGILMLALPSV